jgi:putative ABC transport system permease protein
MNLFDRDNWSEIWNALATNKARTALTAFGVFWGIFMLMLLLGSGRGLENGITTQFQGEATNSFYLWTSRTSKPYRGLGPGRSFEFRTTDARAIRQFVPEIEALAPMSQLGGFRGGNNVTRGAKAAALQVMGVYPAVRAIDAMGIPEGRFVDRLDLEEQRKVAVIGRRVQELLFEPGEPPIGDSIRVQGVYFKVVGIFEPKTRGERAMRDSEKIFIPHTTFQRAFNTGDEIGWFAVTSRADVPASVAEERVIELLKRRHRVHPDDQRAIGHWNTEKEYLKVRGLIDGIGVLVWVVGLGTLAAGVIGVSNIMLIVVRERTKEIGLRRAIGATPLAITSQILLESVVLTALAGYLGLLLGIGLVEGVGAALEAVGSSAELFRAPGVRLADALEALAVLVAAGALAGLIPSRRALAISPVEALRSL